jgi:hypothetical protein
MIFKQPLDIHQEGQVEVIMTQAKRACKNASFSLVAV